jgi:PKD repeat protein
MNYTTMPVIFSALDSNGGDTRGLTFAYDFDSDGAYDETSDYASAQHIYEVAGTYTATVLVTDTEFKLTSAASVEFVVADVSDIATTLPDGVQPELEADVDREAVRPGEDLTLSVANLASDEQFGAKLVAVTEDDPWTMEAAAVFGPFTETAPLHLSKDMVLGPYTLLVMTDAGRTAEIPVSIVGVDTASAANTAGAFLLGPLAYISTGAIVVAAAIVIWFLGRRRRTAER